jgi:predicted PurR-regulated permease PerM
MQKIINMGFVIFFFVIFFGFLYVLSPILMPFLVGALLAYLADPLVVKLKLWHVPNLFSVIIVFFLVFSVLVLLSVLLVPLLQKQIITLIAMIPSMVAWVQNTLMPWLNMHFDVDGARNMDTVKQTLTLAAPKVSGFLSWGLKAMLHSGMTLILWMTNLILIPVVTFYLLRDWDKITRGCRDLLPRSIEPTIMKLIDECDEVLSAFFRGQLLVMMSLGFIYAVGLSLVGLKVGVMIGLIAGAACIVPYLGFIVGIAAASIAALVQFGTWEPLPWIGLVFIVGQCVESFILTPHLIGNRIGLHPVAVIFAILAGGALFGFFGVLLALPVAAVIMVWMRYLLKRYQLSALFQ